MSCIMLFRLLWAIVGVALLIPAAIGAVDAWAWVMFQHTAFWDWSGDRLFASVMLGGIGTFLFIVRAASA